MNENAVEYKRAKGWQLALGGMACAVPTLFVVLMTFASYVATGAYGATSVIAGTIISGTRVLDGITDPIIGIFADRLNSRFGRTRPLLVIGYVMMSICALSMFVFCTGTGNILVFTLIYIFYIIGYTIYGVGSTMIQPVMTNDPKQRPVIGRWITVYTTVIGSCLSIVLAATLMPKHNYQMGLPLFQDLAFMIVGTGAVLVILSIIAITTAKADVPEAYADQRKERVKFRDMWDLIRHNRALQMFTVAAASDKLALQTASQSAITVMVFGIVIGNYSFNAELTFYNMFVTLAVIFLASKLAGNQGMKKALTMWTRIAILGYAVMFVYMLCVDTLQISIKPVLRVSFIILFCLISASRTATSCVTEPLKADVIDYEMSRSGKYIPAVVSTTYSFIDKVVSSLASTIVAVSVAVIGYTEAMPQATDPLTQPLFAVAMFLWLGMPVLGWICTLIAMKFYPLDKETMVEVQKKNAQIRAAVKTEENVG